MKKVRSYTRIFNLERVLQSIQGVQLLIPLTYVQLTWGLGTLVFIWVLREIPPISFINNVFIKYIGLPIFTAWFMSQKTFDGKKPHRFLITVVTFLFNRKKTFAGRPIHLKKQTFDIEYTIIERSERLCLKGQ